MKPLAQSHLFSEIHEQPRIIENLISRIHVPIIDLSQKIRNRNITQVHIAARGTSDNAGRYAKYLLSAHNKLVVSLATPSLFTIYKQPPDLSNTLVLGISQSGKSPDIVSVVKEARKQGALTAAITNIPDSDLAITSDYVLDLSAGQEISLAATKTYTAQLTLLATLSSVLDQKPTFNQNLHELPQYIEKVFTIETAIADLAERYRYMEHCVVIGRGYNYASAFEFSLKLKELTYTIAEPYSSADFLHGPVALVERGFPVFVVAPDGKMTPEMISLVKRVKMQQAEVLVISNHPELLEMADHQIELPDGIPEWLSPIPAIIPAQLFVMYLAQSRGIDVDNPRGLNKVTETW